MHTFEQVQPNAPNWGLGVSETISMKILGLDQTDHFLTLIPLYFSVFQMRSRVLRTTPTQIMQVIELVNSEQD